MCRSVTSNKTIKHMLSLGVPTICTIHVPIFRLVECCPVLLIYLLLLSAVTGCMFVDTYRPLEVYSRGSGSDVTQAHHQDRHSTS